VSSDCNVIDLAKAETHLLAAARYADAKKEKLSKWKELCGRAYFQAAVAAYLVGERENAARRPGPMRICLERSLGYLAKAEALWPKFTEIVYMQAKCLALLGRTTDAIRKLEVLSDRDRRYFAKAAQDGDFAVLRAEAEKVFTRATTSPGPLARATLAKIGKVAEVFAWAKRSAPTSRQDFATIESIEGELSSARRTLSTLDVDIEGLSERLDEIRAELEKVARRSLQQNISAAEEAVTSCEQRKTSCEEAIENLKRTIEHASAPGAGCFAGILAVIIEPFILVPLLNMMSPGARSGLSALFGIAYLAIPIIVSVVGAKVGADHKNQPLNLKIEENLSCVNECIRELPLLKQRAEAWRQKLRSFEAWQAKCARQERL